MSTTAPVSIESLCGRSFVAYSSGDGRVFIERVRRSGRRGRKSIFEFDVAALLSVLSIVESRTVAQIPRSTNAA